MPDALVFLSGPGPIPAGFPVPRTSDQALSGRNAIRHTDSCYYIVHSDYENPGLPWGYVDAVTDFLRHVEQRVVERYNTKGSAALNYKDS